MFVRRLRQGALGGLRRSRACVGPLDAAVGRDHWSSVFTALFAGAGIEGGRVLGRSDEIGAFPTSCAFSLYEPGATIYEALAVSPECAIRDQFGRSLPLSHGKVMSELYAGTDV